MKDVSDYLRRWGRFSEDRETWFNTWELLAKYVMPNKRGFIRQLSKGDTLKDDKVSDGTAIEANQKLSSSLHGALTAPSAKWFSIDFRNKELGQIDEAREWIEDCTERMFKAMSDSNFNSVINEAYLDLTGMGTGNVFCDQRPNKADGSWGGLAFHTFHLSEVAVSENHHGEIDTVYRRYKLSARNAIAKWPDAELPKIRKEAEANPDKLFRFLDVIEPNQDYDPEKQLEPARRPYYHCVIAIDDEEKIEENGYYTRPHLVFRWLKQTGDDYGVGPAHFCMPEVLGLNEAKNMEFDAWDKSIDPPMKAQSGTIVGDVDLTAGGMTMMNDINGLQPLLNQTNWQVTQFKGDEARAQIQRCFFNHLLDFPGGPNVTATEIVRRLELMQREMAPMLGRIQSELLNPMIERVFDIMVRANAFAAPPDVVVQAGGEEVDIEYVSPLARAQKSGDIESIQRWVASLAQLAEVRPEILDWIDTDKIPGILADRMGTPAEAVRSEKEVQEARAARAQQAQAQAEAMAQQQGGQLRAVQ